MKKPWGSSWQNTVSDNNIDRKPDLEFAKLPVSILLLKECENNFINPLNDSYIP